MPVLGQDDVRELAGEPIDQGNDRIPVRHRERAARAKVVLHIDDDQNLAIVPRPRAKGVVHFTLADVPPGPSRIYRRSASQVPIASGPTSFLSAATTESGVKRPVFGFSADGTFSICMEKRAASASTSIL